MYSPIVSQVHSTPQSDKKSSAFARSFSLRGAAELPHCPMTSVVTPCLILLSALALASRALSECEWASINPGDTTRPDASIVFPASASVRSPMTAICPSLIPMSALNHGPPVPLITLPPPIMMSNTGFLPLWYGSKVYGPHDAAIGYTELPLTKIFYSPQAQSFDNRPCVAWRLGAIYARAKVGSQDIDLLLGETPLSGYLFHGVFSRDPGANQFGQALNY